MIETSNFMTKYLLFILLAVLTPSTKGQVQGKRMFCIIYCSALLIYFPIIVQVNERPS